MMPLGQRSRLGTWRQLPLLLLVLLLSQLGLLAFCPSAMAMEAPSLDRSGFELVSADMGIVTAPIPCAAGDCLISSTVPVSLFKSPQMPILLAALGSPWLVLTDNIPLV